MVKALGFAIATLLVMGAALRIRGSRTESGRIDACLDRGGAWDYEQSKCGREGPLP